MEDQEGEFAYVFIEAANPGKSVRGLVGKLRDVDRPRVRVRFATVTVGAYEGFAVVQGLELSDLESFLQEEEEEGVWADQKSAHVEGEKGHRPFKRDGCQMLAIVRIQTKHGESQAVFNKLSGLVQSEEGYHGVSMVFGTFDILLSLDAPDLDTLKGLVIDLQTMPGLDGIARTETAFADCRET